jgi:carbamate kinase
MLVVVGLGGNALLRRGEPPAAETQRRNVARAADALAEIAREHRLVVTHGNGPQIGLLALQAEASPEVPAYPLDLLGAETEGMIGYLIEQELTARLPGRDIATLLTQVEVDPADPAFARPSKPIGPVYTEAAAQRLAAERGWAVARDGTGFRRVVASPEPRRILELRTIGLLMRAGVVAICAGGGGIPVVIDPAGGIRGVEAVIDKDRSTALLATGLGADALLLLTDVPAISIDWGTPAARAVRRAAPEALRRHAFAAGSMGPKVEAACRFVEATGGLAAIGAIHDAAAILRGEAGTTIKADAGPVAFYDPEAVAKPCP